MVIPKKIIFLLFCALNYIGLVLSENLEEILEFETAQAVLSMGSKPPIGNEGKVIYADMEIDEITN